MEQNTNQYLFYNNITFPNQSYQNSIIYDSNINYGGNINFINTELKQNINSIKSSEILPPIINDNLNSNQNYENNYLDLNQMISDINYYNTFSNNGQIKTVNTEPYLYFGENQIKTSYYNPTKKSKHIFQNQNQQNEIIINQKNNINEFAKVTPLNDYTQYTNNAQIIQQNPKDYNLSNNPIHNISYNNEINNLINYKIENISEKYLNYIKENEKLKIEDYQEKINIDVPQINNITNNKILNKNKKSNKIIRKKDLKDIQNELLKNVKSKFIFKKIFSYIDEKEKLNIIKYNHYY